MPLGSAELWLPRGSPGRSLPSQGGSLGCGGQMCLFPSSTRGKLHLSSPETSGIVGFGLFWLFSCFRAPHICLSPSSRSLTTLEPSFWCRGGDVAPKRAAARCHPCPHPASHCSKNPGFSLKPNAGVQNTGQCRMSSHPLCVQGWSHHRGMEDAMMPFLVLKGVNPTELCGVTQAENAVCQRAYKFLSS